ncbi:Cysteine desulfuration protein sufE [uncultured Roseburia sp.]|nr:Cysteine desulfuration protein sufE [uncultured Roseburia sp.]
MDPMSMAEVEDDIKNDIAELKEEISQYTFLVECGADLPEYPDRYRKNKYLIPECQVRTWVYAEWKNSRLYIRADSESLPVRGALSFLLEIYQDRSVQEIAEYSCTLLQFEPFTKHYTKEQLDGLKKVLGQFKSFRAENQGSSR